MHERHEWKLTNNKNHRNCDIMGTSLLIINYGFDIIIVCNLIKIEATQCLYLMYFTSVISTFLHN